MKKVSVQIILKGKEEDMCAKCHKTKQALEIMMKTFPDIRNKIELLYKDISSMEIIEKYGEINAPVVIIDDVVFSEGHVPIIKKVYSSIQESLK